MAVQLLLLLLHCFHLYCCSVTAPQFFLFFFLAKDCAAARGSIQKLADVFFTSCTHTLNLNATGAVAVVGALVMVGSMQRHAPPRVMYCLNLLCVVKSLPAALAAAPSRVGAGCVWLAKHQVDETFRITIIRRSQQPPPPLM